MNKKKRNKKIFEKGRRKPFHFSLPEEGKRKICGVLTFILAIIVTLSFFNLAGFAGKLIFSILTSLIGRVVFLLPLILVLGGLIFFVTPYKKFLGGVIISSLFLILGTSGILESLAPGLKLAGYSGYIAGPLLKFFGF